MIGKRIAHFEILAEIGRGGMGVVYAARDTRLDRRVAIKALHPESDPSPLARDRFEREARAVSRLAHPYICQVFDVLELERDKLIVMELLQGESLQARIGRGRLEVAEALRVALETAEALREAHLHGIVHRDIKPSNLFLTRSGHLKILDFGLARLTAPAGADRDPAQLETLTADQQLTAPALAMGTPGYMPPEQALGRPVDARADVFALGAVLFEMLAGRGPFAAANAAESFHRLFTEDPPALMALRRDVPGPLSELVAAMLARDPTLRPASIEEVYRRLIEISSQRSDRFAAAASQPAAAPGATAAKPAVPKTHYTRSGEINIAYQVVGEGPFDLVYVPGWISHLEYGWEQPRVAHFFHRLASFSRLILFDKRGTGMSDRVSGYPTLEDRMDDLRAVMDAVGSERAAVFGMSEGGNMCVLFAATYPERTIALVTCGIFAKRIWSPDYPWAPTPEGRQKWIDLLEQGWGGTVDVDVMAPSLASDPSFSNWWATYLRLGASPGAALALARFNTQIDIRNLLPAIRVPTLVLHRSGDRDVQVAEGRYVASRIPGAKFVELPGDDHLVYAGDSDRLLDEVEGFLSGVRGAGHIDRVLTTVLCVRVGEAELIAPSARLLEPRLVQFRGQAIRTRTLGLHATFDGPARAIRCAWSLLQAARPAGIELRAGVHTGECELIGAEPFGLPVLLSNQLASNASPFEVLVTGTVKDLVAGAGLDFAGRGSQVIPGVPGDWSVYSASLKA